MTELFARTHSSKDTMTWRSDSPAIEAASDRPLATIEVAASLALAKHVLFISYVFPPSIEMGARTCAQIARYLPLYGWKPVVLTIDESYIEKRYLKESPTAANEEPFDLVIRTKPLPHAFDLYRWIRSTFSTRLERPLTEATGHSTGKHETTPKQKSGLRLWLLSLLSIPDMYTGWLIPAVLAGWRGIRRTKAEAIFSSGPYWTNHLIAYCLMRLTGLPWVVHYRDPWVVGYFQGAFTTKLEFRIGSWLERMTVERSASVVCVTEEHCEILRTSYPQVPADKFVAIPNGFDGAEWMELDKQIATDAQSQSTVRDKFVITYAGKLYINRSPMPVFRALRTLIDRGEIAPDRVRVDLIGWCETSEGRSIADLITETGLDGCVNLVGLLKHDETLQRLAQSDLLLLLAEALTMQVPGKTFEYLKSGRPTLALTSKGAVANLIRQTCGGWAIDPADDEGVLNVVRQCYRDWSAGRAPRAPDPTIVASYDRRVTTAKLGELLDKQT
jgi:glycosyltransferase involved in cell wall biosynthesis